MATAVLFIFLGRIHFSELPAYTQLATIGISLEENIGLNYLYALPNKLFDYIQAHKPMIVSDLPEMRLIIDTYKCGEILLNRSPVALAEQINALLSNTELQNTYSLQAQKAASFLCWEQEKEVLINLYKNA